MRILRIEYNDSITDSANSYRREHNYKGYLLILITAEQWHHLHGKIILDLKDNLGVEHINKHTCNGDSFYWTVQPSILRRKLRGMPERIKAELLLSGVNPSQLKWIETSG